MATFHLPSLPTVLLTVGRNRERHARMRRFFEDYGYSNVQWIYGMPTSNHHAGARETAIETLRSIRCPTLWTEDDATPLPAYLPTIDVPDDAQAVYLGGGRLGRSVLTLRAMKNAGDHTLLPAVKFCLPKEGMSGPIRRSLYADTDRPEWVRLITMFTGHAILWLDDSICREFANIIESSNKPYDIGWATDQWRFKIYCLRSPFFYQDDGHHAHTITYCPPV